MLRPPMVILICILRKRWGLFVGRRGEIVHDVIESPDVEAAITADPINNW